MCRRINDDEENAPFDYRAHYSVDIENAKQELNNRMNDMKNRIELRRMMSEYASGALKPPIFYKHEIIAPDNLGSNAEIDEIEETIYREPLNDKRMTLPTQEERRPSINEFENYDDLKIFHNHRPKYIIENINEQFVARDNEPNEMRQRFYKGIETKEEPGYAEGGIIYEPNVYESSNKRNEPSNDYDSDSSRLLDAVLGFSRHERLDVKKPGPIITIPIEDHPVLNATKTKINNTSESIGILPKIKKILHFGSDDEHAPHSVDPQFAHIIVKNP